MKEKQEFERVVVSRAEALSMFPENKFKAEIIAGLPPDATISLYRCGPMVCAGMQDTHILICHGGAELAGCLHCGMQGPQ